MRFVVQPRPPDMSCRRMLEQVFLNRVAVEPGNCAQPPCHGGPGPAPGLRVAGETLNVGPTDLEQPQLTLLAPGTELAQIQGVGLAGQAGVTGQEPSQRQLLGAGEHRLGDGDHGRRGRRGGDHGYLPDPAETRKAGPAQGPSDDDLPHRQPIRKITQGHHDHPDRYAGSPSMRAECRYLLCWEMCTDNPILDCLRPAGRSAIIDIRLRPAGSLGLWSCSASCWCRRMCRVAGKVESPERSRWSYPFSLSSATSRLAQVCWPQTPLAGTRQIFWKCWHEASVFGPNSPSTSSPPPSTMLMPRWNALTTLPFEPR